MSSNGVTKTKAKNGTTYYFYKGKRISAAKAKSVGKSKKIKAEEKKTVSSKRRMNKGKRTVHYFNGDNPLKNLWRIIEDKYVGGAFPSIEFNTPLNVAMTDEERWDDINILRFDEMKLRALPQLPPNLTELYCSGNLLTSLPELPESLTVLDCSINRLTSLPKLPRSLESLTCNRNRLNSLPALPDGLIDLECHHNNLEKLPSKIPSSLQFLDISNNRISMLPNMPNLLILKANDNDLEYLPNFPQLEELEVGGNPDLPYTNLEKWKKIWKEGKRRL